MKQSISVTDMNFVVKQIFEKSGYFKYLNNGFRRLAIAIGFVISLIAIFQFIDRPSHFNFFEILLGFVFYVVGGVPLALFILNTIAWIIDGFKKDWGSKDRSEK
jgi:hypothetical protein